MILTDSSGETVTKTIASVKLASPKEWNRGGGNEKIPFKGCCSNVRFPRIHGVAIRVEFRWLGWDAGSQIGERVSLRTGEE